MKEKAGSWIGQFVQMMLIRAMEGESQIKEQIQHSQETKSKLQASQALALFVAVCAMGAGLWLIGHGLAQTFKLEMEAGDFGLMGAAIVLAVVMVAAVIRRLLAGMETGLQVVSTVLVILIAFAMIAAAAVKVKPIEYAELLIGTAATIAGLSWAKHQMQELLDPMGRTSGVERMIRPYLPTIFGQDEEEEPEYTDPIPHRLRGHTSLTSASNGDGQRRHAPPWAYNLLEFVNRAAEVGLSRDRVWLKKGKPRYKLSNGNRVTRGMYDTFLEKMELYGWVEKDGDQDAWKWREEMTPHLAADLLEAEINRIEGEAQAHPPTEG
jgi:hypothetical protein